jgi:hypothetical protein
VNTEKDNQTAAARADSPAPTGYADSVALSDCCLATTHSKDNMRFDGERMVCVGTYRVCDKCRMACDYEWMKPHTDALCDGDEPPQTPESKQS